MLTMRLAASYMAIFLLEKIYLGMSVMVGIL